MTVEPLAFQKSLYIEIYDPGKLHDFALQIKQKHAGQTVLISGHSNTTPDLIGLLSNTKQSHLTDTEYDWLFILDVTDGDQYSLKKLKITL
jgi:broad specificity phosphatase PhoE